MNQQEIKNYNLEPSHPTVPIADKFGQAIMFFGLTKVEYLAGLIAGHFALGGPNGSPLYPEVIAREAFDVAIEILKIGQEYRNQSNESTTIIEQP